jgi:hypothetical protein
MGMIERRDGTFSEFYEMDEFTKIMEKQVQRYQEMIKEIDPGFKPLPEYKAFHFGTKQELEEIKGKKALQVQIDELKEEVEQLKPLKSDHVILPTQDDIKRYAKEEVGRIIKEGCI